MHSFLDALKTQRWDDHRFYHHSRINQSLHFVSAVSFLYAYLLLFIDPVMAALVGWLVSMVTRQTGHFFFEPKGYDEVNHASHAYKEAVKVGYNLQRKIVLLTIWAASPAILYFDPTLLGVFPSADGTGGLLQAADFVHRVGLVWLVLGVAGLLFRTVHLFFLRDVQTGLVWLTKILTDPFHDVMLYYRAPFYLLRGQLIDPMLGKHSS